MLSIFPTYDQLFLPSCEKIIEPTSFITILPVGEDRNKSVTLFSFLSVWILSSVWNDWALSILLALNIPSVFIHLLWPQLILSFSHLIVPSSCSAWSIYFSNKSFVSMLAFQGFLCSHNNSHCLTILKCHKFTLRDLFLPKITLEHRPNTHDLV